MSDPEGLPGFPTIFLGPVAGTTGTKWGDGKLGSKSSCFPRGLGVVKK